MIAAHADPPRKTQPRRAVETPPPPKLRLINRPEDDSPAESRPPKAKPGLY